MWIKFVLLTGPNYVNYGCFRKDEVTVKLILILVM